MLGVGPLLLLDRLVYCGLVELVSRSSLFVDHCMHVQHFWNCT